MLKTNGFLERKTVELFSPAFLRGKISVSDDAARNILAYRETIRKIISGKDSRFLMFIGPCSVFDEGENMELARLLKKLSDSFGDKIFPVLRQYFQKTRTRIGWKGLLNDPNGDGSCLIDAGLEKARKILKDVAELGLPIGAEILDPIAEQYICDLVSWGAIGARSVTSVTHREVASGSSMPVGFKNDVYGNIMPAIDGIITARSPQAFLGIDLDGKPEIVYTKGNRDCHLVLRGGKRPNYYPKDVTAALAMLKKEGLSETAIIDASHGNSRKDHAKQRIAFKSAVRQRAAGNAGIVGVMLEANLFPGKQNIDGQTYGVSRTDACIGWAEVEELVGWAYEKLV